MARAGLENHCLGSLRRRDGPPGGGVCIQPGTEHGPARRLASSGKLLSARRLAAHGPGRLPACARARFCFQDGLDPTRRGARAEAASRVSRAGLTFSCFVFQGDVVWRNMKCNPIVQGTHCSRASERGEK